MKTIITFLLIIGFSINIAYADEKDYYLDDQKVDVLFDNAEEQDMDVSASELLALSNANAGSVNPIVAAVLSGCFGWIGIHRMYLGSSQGTIIAYVALGAAGILGISQQIPLLATGIAVLVLVDTVLLIVGAVDDDISQYIDNPKFIMW